MLNAALIKTWLNLAKVGTKAQRSYSLFNERQVNVQLTSGQDRELEGED
jgi:hypothetical protein